MAIDFRRAGHLPKQRVEGEAAPTPQQLPRQRRGTTPQMHGRYPDYDVLENASHWDAETRAVVLDRVANPPDHEFFTAAEVATLSAFCDVVTAQDAEPRIPVLRYIDERLASGRLDGYQHAEMPPDEEVWRRVAVGLDAAAREQGAADYAAAAARQRHDICADFADGKLAGEAWVGMDPKQAWSVVTRFILAAFYAHPWAWNEIGFGGPAYPRGYIRLGPGQRESWEGAEAFERDPVLDER